MSPASAIEITEPKSPLMTLNRPSTMLIAASAMPSVHAHDCRPQAPHAKARYRIAMTSVTAPITAARPPSAALSAAMPIAAPLTSSRSPPKIPKTPAMAARMARIVTPMGRSPAAGVDVVVDVVVTGGGVLAAGGGAAGGGATGSAAAGSVIGSALDDVVASGGGTS